MHINIYVYTCTKLHPWFFFNKFVFRYIGIHKFPPISPIRIQHRLILVFSLFILVNLLSEALIFFNIGAYLISFPECNQSPIAKSYILYPLLDTQSTLDANLFAKLSPQLPPAELFSWLHLDFYTSHSNTVSTLLCLEVILTPWNSKTMCWATQPTSTPSCAAPHIFSIHTWLRFLHPGLDCLPSPHRCTHLAQFLLLQILCILNYTRKWFLRNKL